MRAFTSTELDRMQGTQDGAMQDQGYVLRYTAGTEDDYNLPSPPTYPADSRKTVCGFEPVRPEDRFAHEPDVEAVLRLPIDTVIDNRDRFQLTDRYDESLGSAETYEFVGVPKRGPSGLVCKLKRTTNASR